MNEGYAAVQRGGLQPWPAGVGRADCWIRMLHEMHADGLRGAGGVGCDILFSLLFVRDEDLLNETRPPDEATVSSLRLPRDPRFDQ